MPDCANHSIADDSCGGVALRIVGGRGLCERCASAALAARTELTFAGRCRCGATAAHVWTAACETQAGHSEPGGQGSTSGTVGGATGDSRSLAQESDRQTPDEELTGLRCPFCANTGRVWRTPRPGSRPSWRCGFCGIGFAQSEWPDYSEVDRLRDERDSLRWTLEMAIRDRDAYLANWRGDYATLNRIAKTVDAEHESVSFVAPDRLVAEVAAVCEDARIGAALRRVLARIPRTAEGVLVCPYEAPVVCVEHADGFRDFGDGATVGEALEALAERLEAQS